MNAILGLIAILAIFNAGHCFELRPNLFGADCDSILKRGDQLSLARRHSPKSGPNDKQDTTGVYCSRKSAVQKDLEWKFLEDSYGNPIEVFGKQYTHSLCQGKYQMNVWAILTPDGQLDRKYSTCKIADLQSKCDQKYGKLPYGQKWHVQPMDQQDYSNWNLFLIAPSQYSPGELSVGPRMGNVMLLSEDGFGELVEKEAIYREMGESLGAVCDEKTAGCDAGPRPTGRCRSVYGRYSYVSTPILPNWDAQHKTAVFCSRPNQDPNEADFEWNFLSCESTGENYFVHGAQKISTVCEDQVQFNVWEILAPNGKLDGEYARCKLSDWQRMCERQFGRLPTGTEWNVQPVDLENFASWNLFKLNHNEFTTGQVSLTSDKADSLYFSTETHGQFIKPDTLRQDILRLGNTCYAD